jgi:hypothetical protein
MSFPLCGPNHIDVLQREDIFHSIISLSSENSWLHCNLPFENDPFLHTVVFGSSLYAQFGQFPIALCGTVLTKVNSRLFLKVRDQLSPIIPSATQRLCQLENLSFFI